MAGTTGGARAASKTNRGRYGEDFYARIGRIGGKKGTTGGFASEDIGDDGLTGRERASLVGIIGGRKSRKNKKVETDAILEI